MSCGPGFKSNWELKKTAMSHTWDLELLWCKNNNPNASEQSTRRQTTLSFRSDYVVRKHQKPTWTSSLIRVILWNGRTRKERSGSRWQTGLLSNFSTMRLKPGFSFLKKKKKKQTLKSWSLANNAGAVPNEVRNVLHESLVGGVLIGLVGEVGHINHLEALAVASDDVTHRKVHDVRLQPLLQLCQETKERNIGVAYWRPRWKVFDLCPLVHGPLCSGVTFQFENKSGLRGKCDQLFPFLNCIYKEFHWNKLFTNTQRRISFLLLVLTSSAVLFTINKSNNRNEQIQHVSFFSFG